MSAKKKLHESHGESDGDDDNSSSSSEADEPAAKQGDGPDNKLGYSTAEQEAKQLADELPIKEFDWNTVNLDSLVAVIGKRRFGKTTFARFLASRMKDYYPEVYVFTKTPFNGYWQQHVPAERVYEGLDWPMVMQIWEGQRLKWEEIKRDGGKYKKNPYILIIFEDVAADRSSMRYSEEIARAAFNGRHYFTSMWFLLQDMKAFNRDVRGNVDFLFTTYSDQHQIVESIQREYCDFWKNPMVFKFLVQKYTQDFGMLCLAQPKAAYTACDKIFKVAPVEEDPAPFQLGFPRFWSEAGCDWKEQLHEYGNIKAVMDRKKDTDWRRISKREYAEQKRELAYGYNPAKPIMVSNSVQAFGNAQERRGAGLDGKDKSVIRRNTRTAPLIKYKPPDPKSRQLRDARFSTGR